MTLLASVSGRKAWGVFFTWKRLQKSWWTFSSNSQFSRLSFARMLPKCFHVFLCIWKIAVSSESDIVYVYGCFCSLIGLDGPCHASSSTYTLLSNSLPSYNRHPFPDVFSDLFHLSSLEMKPWPMQLSIRGQEWGGGSYWTSLACLWFKLKQYPPHPHRWHWQAGWAYCCYYTYI